MMGSTTFIAVDLAEKTYRRLRDLIVRGRLAPQKRLIEDELAERLGVSRTPVRDALRRLRAEDYVLDTGRGARSTLEVRGLSRADVDELWTMLGSLEGSAATRAAALPDDARAELVERMRAINRELREQGRPPRGSPDRLMELQSGFHRELVESAGGPRLNRVYDLLRPHAERYEWIYGSHEESDLLVSAAEHDVIINLIESGEADAAAQAIRDHWERARGRTGELIERYWG